MPPVRVTVKVSSLVPLSPSVTATSLIDTEPATATTALSSLVIVPTPCESLIVAPLVALLRFMKKDSVGSTVVSPTIVTDTGIVFTPTPNARSPPMGT